MIPVEFKLPFYGGISANQAYYHQGNMKRLSTNAKNLRARIMCWMRDNQIKLDHEGELLEIYLGLGKDWYFKNGKIAKRDLDNCLKFLIDSIFNELKVDDLHIFRIVAEKIPSEVEFTIIKIWEIEKEETT